MEGEHQIHSFVQQRPSAAPFAGASVASPSQPSLSDIGSSNAGAVGGEKHHKRGYQACIPCRKRKVRCDLGPIDEPHDPPCARCKREVKECFFSATRRKRKNEDDHEDAIDDDADAAAHLARRKSARAQGSIDHGHDDSRDIRGTSPIPSQSPLNAYGQPQISPSYHLQHGNPSPHPSTVDAAQEQQEVYNERASTLFQSPINTPGDALHLLLQASGQSEVLESHTPSQSVVAAEAFQNTPSSSHPARRDSVSRRPTSQSDRLGPAVTAQKHGSPSPSRELLNIWARLRFVRAGWFTAREAMAYIDYYYKYLAPLTPVSHPDLRTLESNPGILSEEPVLTVTLLTISSRYMHLTGAGSQTRSMMVHERLWKYLQNMVTRMFWGQEQFGGGFCGAGARKRASKGTERGRLRTVGTVESLLLLSDFHPRSMHFPPNDDDEDILAPDDDTLRGLSSAEEANLASSTDSTFAGWTEPAVRSDRMTWSLIAFAHALAFELGIFGTFADGLKIVDGRVKRPGGPLMHHKRADRLERLLYIYMTQACGRFGFPSMYPDHLTNYNLQTMTPGFTSVDSTMLENQSPGDKVQDAWVDLTAINKNCNDTLFKSKDFIENLIRTGDYVNKLQQPLAQLNLWRDRLHKAKMDKHPKILLSIEVEYFRLYMNGIALQAVIDTAITRAGGNAPATSPQSPDSTASSSFSNMQHQNESYVREVVDASRAILRHVVHDLLPDDFLKHAPVRAYFRIVSAAMFLLKTFALGAKRTEVNTSLELLDQTINAFRTSVVDDVHLCLRIADLLENLTSSIRQKFIPWTAQHSYSPQMATKDPTLYPANTTTAEPLQQPAPQGIRYVRQMSQANQPGQMPAYLGAPDSDITVIPPPRGMYNNTTFNMTNFPAGPLQQQQQQQPPPQFYPHPQQQQQQQAAEAYAQMNNNHASAAADPNSIRAGPEDDWMTIDLNPLLNNEGMVTGVEDDWFGNGFGPDTYNNLEVLGKLVNEGSPWGSQPGGGSGGADMGF